MVVFGIPYPFPFSYMKLLFVTQIWDEKDSVLGFVPSWVAKLGAEADRTSVIAMKVKSVFTPPRTEVYSLGKERGASRLVKILRFLILVWRLRHTYDTVFVHMNPEYVVLAGLLWRVMGKQVVLWYAHGSVTTPLRIAILLAHVVLTSTPEGCRVSSPKVRVVGQAIDTKLFTPASNLPPVESLVIVGRVAPTKGHEVSFRALSTIHKTVPGVSLTIIGAPVHDRDVLYQGSMRELSRTLGIEESVVWRGPLSREELALDLPMFGLCINMSTNGSLDKAGLEALSSGVPVVTRNEAFRSVLADDTALLIPASDDPESLVRTIIRIMALTPSERGALRERLREQIVRLHSIDTFATRVWDACSPFIKV